MAATKKQAKKSTHGSHATGSHATGSHAKGTSRRWSAKVNTESTYPEEGLFKQDAETIARRLASKKVSPKGPASGMRMLVFFENRAGNSLSTARRKVLEHAKELLHEKVVAARKKRAA
ncbi:DUF3175 domain-containing protein [Terriglobus albidus]|uniref:DUF3175 domain-containing protein n=1 Tax=Terriglobus albidus TaxID=1592106 RepID=UPI0021E07966|nr:DUF3175 domain-containing protein [Terriglobus albidus]